MDTGADAINARLRLFSWLAAIGGGVVLILIAIFMTVVLILALRVQDAAQTVELQAQQSYNALCAIEENATKQIRAQTTFLAKNPNGIPGISAEEIEAGIQRQRDFLDALRDNVFCGSDDA